MSLSKLWNFLNLKGTGDAAIVSPEISALLVTAHETFVELAAKFNAETTSDSLRISVAAPAAEPASGKENSRMVRFSVANAFWAISVRAANTKIEFFVLPSVQLPLKSGSETASRLKLKISASREDGAVVYRMDDVALELGEAKTLVAALLKDVLQRSKADFDFLPENVRLQYDNQSLTAAVRELIKEKSVLTDRIAGQQDSLQAQIASEIHDTVISDLLFVLRKLESDEPLSKDESKTIIEGVVTKLRELCAELVPRNIGDWGLCVLLEDLFNKMCARSGLKGAFTAPAQELPSLPADIELQIFRIAQECLNNVEKHSRASCATVQIDLEQDELTILIADDGVGYDQIPSSKNGSGVSIMTERVNLIRMQMPASLQFESRPGAGTKAILKVQVPVEG